MKTSKNEFKINVYPELTEFYNKKSPPPPQLIFGTINKRSLFCRDSNTNRQDCELIIA